MSREQISLRICWAIWAWVSERARVSTKSRASVTGLRQKVSMSSPPTVTARASFFSRRPRQVGQGHWLMHSSSSFREASDWVSVKRRSTLVRMPSKACWKEPIPSAR